MTHVPLGLLVVVAMVGIALAAALSAGEVAVGRVTLAAVTELLAERHPAAERVRRLVEQRRRVASSAAFVRLLGEMTATVCITLVVASSGLAWGWVLLVAGTVCAAVAYLLVRASPRTVGRQHPLTVLTVLSRLLVAVSGAVFGAGAGDGGAAFTAPPYVPAGILERRDDPLERRGHRTAPLTASSTAATSAAASAASAARRSASRRPRTRVPLRVASICAFVR